MYDAGRAPLVDGVRRGAGAGAAAFFSGFFLNGFRIVMLASFPPPIPLSLFLSKSRGFPESVAIFDV